MTIYQRFYVNRNGREIPFLRDRMDLLDARRPETEDYLLRPDMPIIGNDFVERCRQLAGEGVCKAQIAERLRCNLRDVFRALVGDDYLTRFTDEKEPIDYSRGRSEWRSGLIEKIIRDGERSVRAISIACGASANYVKEIVEKVGGIVLGDTILVGDLEIAEHQAKIREQKLAPLKNWWRLHPRKKTEKKRVYRERITGEKEKEIIQAIKSTGKPYRRIAQDFGVSVGSVSHIAKKIGEPPRSTGYGRGVSARKC